MRDLQLTIEPRPTGPGPYTLEPEPDTAPSKWREALTFAGAVVIGAAIFAGRTMLARPFATVTFGAFLVGALAVASNFWAQPRSHPAPLFQRAAAPVPEATASIPRRDDPIARLAAEPAPAPATAPQRERREIVRDIQQELARRGLYDGPVEGRFGPRTQAAIRAFEQQAGLPQTGEATEALLQRVRAVQTQPTSRPPAAPAQPTHAAAQRPVATAPAVEPARAHPIVHRRLAEMGYAPGRVSAEATPEFRRAVERFQRDNDLPPTGQVDQRFLDRLAAVTGPLR